jgi:HEAT repeat protein
VLGLLAMSLVQIVSAQEAPNSDLLKLVIDLLGEKDAAMRSVAYEQVRSGKGEAATKQFAAQLAKLSPEAQSGLLSALADRGDAVAKPAVVALLTTSKDATVIEAALLALGKLGDASDTTQLLSFLNSSSAAENAAATASLSRLRGAKVNQEIVAAMQKATPATAANMIKILATRRAEDTLPQLLQAAVHNQAEIRMAAMSALAELAEVDALPGLLRGVLMAQDGEEFDAAEKAIVAVCGKNPQVNERAVPVIQELSKFNAAEQIKLLSVVARVGGTSAYQLVETAMQNSDPARSAAGWKALGKWPDASIAPKLLELARTSKDAEQRALSLKAFVRAASMRDARSDQDRLKSMQEAMKLAQNDEERNLVLSRCRTAYTVESLRFVRPYLDQAQSAQVACETIVELAHHREIREPNKTEFDPALDLVMKLSSDAVVKERAQLYKNGQTWSKPSTPKPAATKSAK